MTVDLARLPDDKRKAVLAAGVREFSRKSYSQVSTDEITRQCGISKGLLFHYFGSKASFYEYCLENALARLVEPQANADGGDFYSVIFSSMDEKLRLCSKLPDETRLVNMASRETAAQAAQARARVFPKYLAQKAAQSQLILGKAFAALPLKDTDACKLEGLTLYINAVMQKFLLEYQERPEDFFRDGERIKTKIKEYLDVMLYGIIREDAK